MNRGSWISGLVEWVKAVIAGLAAGVAAVFVEGGFEPAFESIAVFGADAAMEDVADAAIFWFR